MSRPDQAAEFLAAAATAAPVPALTLAHREAKAQLCQAVNDDDQGARQKRVKKEKKEKRQKEKEGRKRDKEEKVQKEKRLKTNDDEEERDFEDEGQKDEKNTEGEKNNEDANAEDAKKRRRQAKPLPEVVIDSDFERKVKLEAAEAALPEWHGVPPLIVGQTWQQWARKPTAADRAMIPAKQVKAAAAEVAVLRKQASAKLDKVEAILVESLEAVRSAQSALRSADDALSSGIAYRKRRPTGWPKSPVKAEDAGNPKEHKARHEDAGEGVTRQG